MIERLPTPWGLVRLGVAPDHPKIKAVSKAFEKIAAQPGFRFLGNVEVGRDLTAEDLAPPLRRGCLRGRGTDRSPHGHPRRGPARLVARDRVRRLVQRPPRLPGALVRPLRRARGCGRGRQRRHRRRADARACARGDPADRHDRRGDRRDPRLRAEGDRPAGPARPGPGGVHDARAEGARRAGRRRRRSSTPPTSSSIRRARPRSRRTRTRAGTSRCFASTRPARRPGVAAIHLRFCVSPVAILGEDRVEAIEIVRNRLVADEAGRVPRSRPTSARRSRAGSSSGASATRGSSCRASRSKAAGSRTRAAESAAGVYCAGWIKRGPSGVIGTNKKDATETVELLLEDARAGKLHRGDPARPRRPSTSCWPREASRP